MCKKIRTPKELENFIEKIHPDMKIENICIERTLDCMEWYSRKAVLYKKIFFILSTINIAAPLISTYIISAQEQSMFAAILSVLATFSASMLALFNVNDKWVTYRSASEYLKSQYTLYCAKSSPYNKDDAHIIYINNIETYMTTVHSHWCSFHKVSNN